MLDLVTQRTLHTETNAWLMATSTVDGRVFRGPPWDIGMSLCVVFAQNTLLASFPLSSMSLICCKSRATRNDVMTDTFWVEGREYVKSTSARLQRSVGDDLQQIEGSIGFGGKDEGDEPVDSVNSHKVGRPEIDCGGDGDQDMWHDCSDLDGGW